MSEHRLCSRCRATPASTPGNAYCKPCRAQYQREWRARRKGLPAGPDSLHEPQQRSRLRATPTRADLQRYRLA